MEIVILPDNEAIGGLAADAIGNLLQRKPDAVLGLATGSSPLAIYDALIAEILGGVDYPRDAADRLVRAAVAAGGRDNATAIVVDVVGLVKDATYYSQRQLQSL